MFLVGGIARAEPGDCKNVRILSDTRLPAEWADAVRDAELHLSTLETRCVVLEVRVEPAGVTGLRVRAAAEGRRAERLVPKPSALTPTIVGLVSSIPADTLNTPPREKPSDVGPPAALVPASAPPLPVHLWSGVSTGARVSQPALFDMFDVEGRVDLSVRDWLVVASLRYGRGLGGDVDDASTYSEAAFGLGAGRQFAVGKTLVDLALVPSLATMRFDDQDESGVHGSLIEFRVGLSARWLVNLGPSWRLTLTADTDVAPEGLIHPVRVESQLPPLPAWTGALRVGASGRLL
jgi:hypothetical protein